MGGGEGKATAHGKKGWTLEEAEALLDDALSMAKESHGKVAKSPQKKGVRWEGDDGQRLEKSSLESGTPAPSPGEMGKKLSDVSKEEMAEMVAEAMEQRVSHLEKQGWSRQNAENEILRQDAEPARKIAQKSWKEKQSVQSGESVIPQKSWAQAVAGASAFVPGETAGSQLPRSPQSPASGSDVLDLGVRTRDDRSAPGTPSRASPPSKRAASVSSGQAEHDMWDSMDAEGEEEEEAGSRYEGTGIYDNDTDQYMDSKEYRRWIASGGDRDPFTDSSDFEDRSAFSDEERGSTRLSKGTRRSLAEDMRNQPTLLDYMGPKGGRAV